MLDKRVVLGGEWGVFGRVLRYLMLRKLRMRARGVVGRGPPCLSVTWLRWLVNEVDWRLVRLVCALPRVCRPE